MPFDPTLLLLVALIAVMAFFMFRNNKKRQQEALKLQDGLVPGAEIMTQHGIYGTLVSIDRESNEAIIETTPGTRLRVHSQTVSRVIEPELPEADEAVDEPSEPEFGERSDEPGTDRRPDGSD